MKTIGKFFAIATGLLLSSQLLSATPPLREKTAAKFESERDLRAMLEALTQVDPTPFDKFSPEKFSSFGYWSMQQLSMPPLPGNPLKLNLWSLGDGMFVLDDRQVDYSALAEIEMTYENMFARNPSLTSSYASLYSTNDLWLEIISVDTTNQQAGLLLHNTADAKLYQLLTKTNLLQLGEWTLGEIKNGDYGTNETLFSPANIADNSMMFFRAQQADWQIYIGGGNDAIEPQGSDPGQTGTFYIFGSGVSGATNNLTVYYRISGTASNGVDYVTLPGQATITNGASPVMVDIKPLADNFVEGNESITLTIIPTNTYLIDPNSGNSASISLWDSSTTILIYPLQNAFEPDSPPNVAATIGSFAVYRYDFRNINTNLAVTYLVSGTASNGVDYQLLSGVLNFLPGIDLTNLDISPLKDSLPEGLETVTMTLVPTNSYLVYTNYSSATITIADSTTTVSMGVLSAGAIEPNWPIGVAGMPASFFVHRSDARGIYTNMVVRYVVSGTASNGLDYSFLSGTVNFAPGMTDTNLIIAPLADSTLEGSETVTVTLLNLATNGYVINTNSATGTAVINDTTTTVSMSVTAANAVEQDGPLGVPAVLASYNLHRSDTRGIYTNLAVSYVVSGTASNGVDYVFLSGTAYFVPGMTDTNIVVNPLSDTSLEGLETVTLNLVSAVTNSYLVDTNQAGGTISIIDTTTTVSLFSNTTNAVEPDGPSGAPAVTASFRLHRSDTRSMYTNLPVNYLIGGTASNGVDYAFLSGTAYFSPGMTDTNIIINPSFDTAIEGLETMTLNLVNSTANSYLIITNQASASATIIDTTTTLTGVSASVNAIEPRSNGTGGQTGSFHLTRVDTRGVYPSLTAQYSISGTATNGLDYTNLTGFVTFAAGNSAADIFVQPIIDDLIWEGSETVGVTLLLNQTNLDSYLINSNLTTATLTIADAAPIFGFITNIVSPIGIDYHAPSNALVVSYNYSTFGNPYILAFVYTNLSLSNSVVITNIIVTNWSGVHGSPDEVKLATVKNTADGFTNGEVFYGGINNFGIPSVCRVSADGTWSNINWCTLVNSTVTTAQGLRGSLYVDQTGVFSNNVIVVTSDSGASSSRKGVWRVDAQANPILLTNLLTPHLEGVITLPNDVNKWGPWAGKIITGDEDFPSGPKIYTIAAHGEVVSFDTTMLSTGGIYPEDFDIIPPNQNLYGCDNGINALVKVPASYFANFVGDLLITDAGENVGPAKLFVVHWDAATTNFVMHKVSYLRANGTSGSLEHVTFAPIDIMSK